MTYYKRKTKDSICTSCSNKHRGQRDRCGKCLKLRITIDKLCTQCNLKHHGKQEKCYRCISIENRDKYSYYIKVPKTINKCKVCDAENTLYKEYCTYHYKLVRYNNKKYAYTI